MPLTRAQRLKQSKGENLVVSARSRSKSGDLGLAWYLPNNLLALGVQYLTSKSVKQWLRKNIGEVTSSAFVLLLIAHFYLAPIRSYTSNLTTLQCVTGYDEEKMFSGQYIPCVSDLAFAAYFSLIFVSLIFFVDASVSSIFSHFSINSGVKERAKYSENLVQFVTSSSNVLAIIAMMFFNFISGSQNSLNFMKLQNSGSYLFHEKLIFVLQASQYFGWVLFSLATMKKFATIKMRLAFNTVLTINAAIVYTLVLPMGFVWLLCMHSILAFITLKDLLKKTYNTVFAYAKLVLYAIFLASIALYVVDTALKYDAKNGIQSIISKEDSMFLVILIFVPSLASC